MRKLLIGAGLLLAATGANAADCYDLTITDSASKVPGQSEWSRHTQPEAMKLCNVSDDKAILTVLSNDVSLPAYRNAPGVYTLQMNGATLSFTLRPDGTLLHTQSNMMTGWVAAATGVWK